MFDLVVDVEVLFQMLDPEQLFPALHGFGAAALRLHRIQKHFGVLLLRGGDQLCRGVFLDDPAAVKDPHPVTEGRNQAQIVGDEEDGHAALLLQLLQQLQDARLNGDIEVSRRFVRDQQLCPAGKRQSDDNTLPLAAGELVRVLG